MKLVFGIFVLSTLVISSAAQSHVAPAAKALVELSASSEKIVRGAPFSADAVSESIQVLADGNRIVRSTTTKLHRNGEGRFRREFSSGSGGLYGSTYSFGPGVTIVDPVVGHRYQLDTEARTVLQGELRAAAAVEAQRARELATTASQNVIKIERPLAVEKLRTELKGEAPVAVLSGTGGTSLFSYTPSAGGAMVAGAGMTRYETRTEQLGVQNIEGVDAEGTRTITTIPAGAIGNERPIEITYERWFSNELQLVVMSKQSDPRFGEQTYRLTNIIRSEPDPSLFAVPTGYKIVPQGRTVHRETFTRIEAEKAAGAKGGTTYVRTKP
jgi:hypothetical protein